MPRRSPSALRARIPAATRGKKAKRRNRAESSGSCTYAGSAPDRCRGGRFSSREAKSSSSVSLPRPCPRPSSFPRAGFLRSEACVRVSPSFPFIAAHSSASPSRVLGVTAFSPAREYRASSLSSSSSKDRDAIRNLLACSSLGEGRGGEDKDKQNSLCLQRYRNERCLKRLYY